MDVLDQDATRKLEQWFNDRWTDKWCVDITKELIQVIDESWARAECPPPYHIPPTFFKVMSNFYLQQIWKRAEDVLRQADHLIFCGYSFPDADLHFKYLLKRAEINRASAPTAPTQLPLSEFHSDEDHQPEHLEVFIINEHPGKTRDARQAERDRYFRFFRDKPRVHWTTLTFEAFANNPAAYANPANWTR